MIVVLVAVLTVMLGWSVRARGSSLAGWFLPIGLLILVLVLLALLAIERIQAS